MPAITPLLRAFLTASETRVELLAQQERDRLAEREQLVAEREAAQGKIDLAQRNVRRVQRRWASVLLILTVLVVLGTGAGLWVVFEGWRSLMVNRSEFIAGIIDRQTSEGDHVTAMLLGLEALPDPTSESIRQRWLPVEMTAVHALDGAWRNWRTEWGERAIFDGHTNSVTAVVFSPDGTRVLTGSRDNTARLWDAASGKPIATLAGHTASVTAVAFSPDGTRVLTGSEDNTARLWDAASGKPIATLAGHTSWVTAVVFSPDGTRVLTGSRDNTARLWRLFKTVPDLIDTVRVSVPRCLTSRQRRAFYLGTPTPRWCYVRNLWPFTDRRLETPTKR
jgi:hypothetical protein